MADVTRFSLIEELATSQRDLSVALADVVDGLERLAGLAQRNSELLAQLEAAAKEPDALFDAEEVK